MIRTVPFLAVLLLAGVAHAQPADLRAALVFDHASDFAGAPGGAPHVHTVPATPALPADVATDDPWFGRDKVLHAGFSFLTTLSAQYVLQAKLEASRDEALPVAAGVTLGLGVAKEVADSRRPINPLFSTRDIVADAVGVALAVGLILL